MWKSVDGYEGRYEVSDDGLVKSLDRVLIDRNGQHRAWRGRMMKQTKSHGRDGDGYIVVNLRKNGSSYVVPVHVLVANAFIPNPLGLPTVNHIDGNKNNNNVTNLEWATYGENNTHALRCGLREPRSNPIVQKAFDGTVIATFCSVSEASRVTGIGRGVISHCVNHRIKSAGGYVWEKLLEGLTTIS